MAIKFSRFSRRVAQKESLSCAEFKKSARLCAELCENQRENLWPDNVWSDQLN